MSVLDKAEYTLGRPQYHLRIKEEENTGLVQGWENAIAVTLEGIYRYESGGHGQASAG